ncbi:MAG: glycosyltransferase family 4 protein [Rhodospirillales bacterium]|nr:glycosyltransferase family 4 protein [Rhodospirillales bacterium]
MKPTQKSATAKKQRPICVVINGIHAKSGGGVTYLRKMLPELAKAESFDIHLLLHAEQFELFYPIPDNIKVSIFTFRSSFFATFVWEQFSLPLIANAMGADIVFSPANYGPIFAKNHVILLRNAVSVIRHIDRLGPALYWSILSVATLVSFLTCKRAIAVSYYAARILTFRLPQISKKRLSVVYHGATPVEPARDNSKKPSHSLLAVSDIYIQKNYHTLIEAFAKIKPSYPELTLNIVGREIDKPYVDRVRRLTHELGVEDRVRFHGYLEMDKIIEMYRTCEVFVFPSVVETFGNPLLEAMSAGAPIACSKTAAMPEVIEDAGLLFDPYDANDIAAKIEHLLSDAELRRELGNKALDRSREFTWSRTAQQTSDVLYGVVGNRPLPPQRFR